VPAVTAPRPVSLTPPLFRASSISSTMSRESFLSSHHSDDDLMTPEWPLPPFLPEVEDTLSPSTPPPGSRTPVSPTPSSTSTARPSRSLNDLLRGIKDEMDRLGTGQKDTNNILDDIRDLIPPPSDPELGQRLNRIENLLQGLLDQPRVVEIPVPRTPVPPAPAAERPISHTTESTEPTSEPSSDYTAELDRLLQRFRDAAGERAAPPVPPPQPERPALSLDDELAAMLRAPIPSFPHDIARPPPLKPFEYHPAARVARPRSASPTVPPRPSTVPITAPVVFDEDTRRPVRRIRRPESEISYEPVVPPGPPRRPPAAVQILGDPGRDRRPVTEVPPPEPVIVSPWPSLLPIFATHNIDLAYWSWPAPNCASRTWSGTTNSTGSELVSSK
jgi:hypothetical protein